MNTLQRCGWVSWHALVLAAGIAATPAQAQVQRNFPQTALRGDITFLQPPEILLNGKPARLSPGSRIRGADNLMVMSGALPGLKAKAHYTLETHGMVHDVWLLTPAEAAKGPWPKTPQEAAAWQFDPVAQVWSRP